MYNVISKLWKNIYEINNISKCYLNVSRLLIVSLSIDFSNLLINSSFSPISGCGSIAPKSTWGKVATMGYASLGIPLTLVYLSSAGGLLSRCARGVFTRALCCCLCSNCGYCCYDERRMQVSATWRIASSRICVVSGWKKNLIADCRWYYGLSLLPIEQTGYTWSEMHTRVASAYRHTRRQDTRVLRDR